MRICYLGNAASIHTVRWANYFAEHNCSVDLITWHAPLRESTIHQGIKTHRIFFPPHYVARYGALLEIMWLVRKIRPDVIHAHYLGHFGILAGLYGRLTGFRPIVLTAWGSDALIEAKLCKRWLIGHALRQSHCVTCDAQHMVGVLSELGADPQKIRLVYFGTDTRKFSPEQRSEKLRGEWGNLDSPIVASLRSLTPIYDVESLIKAVPLVLQEVPEAKFVIAGKGPEKARLKSLCESLGVSSNVRFVGFIPNHELPQYLASFDVYVSTSLSDAGLAASTAEAMACGLPVVITDFGDNSKWVEDGVNGLLVPLKDPEALAAKIIYLLRNKEDRIRFGQAGRKVIEERSSYEGEMGKMERIYEELTERYQK